MTRLTRLTRMVVPFLVAVPSVIGLTAPVAAQGGPEPPDRGGFRGPDREAGPDGPGRPGGPSREEDKLLEAHDANGDGWLNLEERAEARKAITQRRAAGESAVIGLFGHESASPSVNSLRAMVLIAALLGAVAEPLVRIAIPVVVAGSR